MIIFLQVVAFVFWFGGLIALLWAFALFLWLLSYKPSDPGSTRKQVRIFLITGTVCFMLGWFVLPWLITVI